MAPTARACEGDLNACVCVPGELHDSVAAAVRAAFPDQALLLLRAHWLVSSRILCVRLSTVRYAGVVLVHDAGKRGYESSINISDSVGMREDVVPRMGPLPVLKLPIQRIRAHECVIMQLMYRNLALGCLVGYNHPVRSLILSVRKLLRDSVPRLLSTFINYLSRFPSLQGTQRISTGGLSQ